MWEAWQAFIVEILAIPGFMETSLVGGIVSKDMAKYEQGLGQGAYSGLKTFCAGVGPLLMSLLFAFFTSNYLTFSFPQAPFILCSILVLIGIYFFLKLPLTLVYRSDTERKSENLVTNKNNENGELTNGESFLTGEGL